MAERVGGHMVGQFFTPELIARTMFRLAGARVGQAILDPSCGDGVFAKCCPSPAGMYGCELDDRYGLEVAKLLPSGHIVRGDALTKLVQWHGKFDLVVGNPPFSARRQLEVRSEVLQAYEFGIGRPRQSLEVLFLELFIRLAKPGGKIAIILPDGILGNAYLHGVREWILQQGHVEYLLGLPRKAFEHTSAKTTLLGLRKFTTGEKVVTRKTSVFQIEALAQLAELSTPSRGRGHGWKAVNLAGRKDWRPEAETQRLDTEQATVPLGSIAKLRRGAAVYGAQRELYGTAAADRVLLLRAKNLAPSGGLRIDPGAEVVYISKIGLMFRQQAIVQAGEIVMVRVGTRCYGRCALVPAGLEAQADDWLLVITPVVKMDAPGLVGWLNSAEGRSNIQRLAKGVGSLSISKSSLATLQIPRAFITHRQ